ncbi:hypothetical protein LTR86_004773 [Recurvomyces mirabilis]|nr:hypothetical protein LTR86_004773 [Recurvomyces mirabilis]
MVRALNLTFERVYIILRRIIFLTFRDDSCLHDFLTTVDPDNHLVDQALVPVMSDRARGSQSSVDNAGPRAHNVTPGRAEFANASASLDRIVAAHARPVAEAETRSSGAGQELRTVTEIIKQLSAALKPLAGEHDGQQSAVGPPAARFPQKATRPSPDHRPVHALWRQFLQDKRVEKCLKSISETDCPLANLESLEEALKTVMQEPNNVIQLGNMLLSEVKSDKITQNDATTFFKRVASFDADWLDITDEDLIICWDLIHRSEEWPWLRNLDTARKFDDLGKLVKDLHHVFCSLYADELLEALFDKLVRLSRSSHVAIFEIILMPCLADIVQSMPALHVAENDAQYGIMAAKILQELLGRWVQYEPSPPKHLLRECGCGCVDCEELDGFLMDRGKRILSIREKSAIREHLCCMLDSQGDLVERTTLRNGSPHTLIISKINGEFEQCKWDCRRKQAKKWINNLGNKECLRDLLDLMYDELLDFVAFRFKTRTTQPRSDDTIMLDRTKEWLKTHYEPSIDNVISTHNIEKAFKSTLRVFDDVFKAPSSSAFFGLLGRVFPSAQVHHGKYKQHYSVVVGIKPRQKPLMLRSSYPWNTTEVRDLPDARVAVTTPATRRQPLREEAGGQIRQPFAQLNAPSTNIVPHAATAIRPEASLEHQGGNVGTSLSNSALQQLNEPERTARWLRQHFVRHEACIELKADLWEDYRRSFPDSPDHAPPVTEPTFQSILVTTFWRKGEGYPRHDERTVYGIRSKAGREDRQLVRTPLRTIVNPPALGQPRGASEGKRKAGVEPLTPRSKRRHTTAIVDLSASP